METKSIEGKEIVRQRVVRDSLLASIVAIGLTGGLLVPIFDAMYKHQARKIANERGALVALVDSVMADVCVGTRTDYIPRSWGVYDPGTGEEYTHLRFEEKVR
jgi:hypothetical protein